MNIAKKKKNVKIKFAKFFEGISRYLEYKYRNYYIYGDFKSTSIKIVKTLILTLISLNRRNYFHLSTLPTTKNHN